MKKKTLLLLAGAYLGGVAATLIFNKKNPSEISKEISSTKTKEEEMKVILNNFIDIHKNLLETFKEKYLTQENKDKLTALFDEYRVKAEKIYEEYKEKGETYAKTGLDKLEIFYKAKIHEVDEIKDKAPEKIQDIKSKIIAYYNDFKEKIEKE